jgi:hypothetical protein
MYFTYGYDDRTLKPVKIILRKKRENDGGESTKPAISIYGNVTMKPPVQ